VFLSRGAGMGQREPDDRGIVGQFAVAIRDDLVLAETRLTAGAPGHDVVALVEPAFLPDALEEGPDGVVVLGGKGEVRAAQLGHAQLTHDLLCGSCHGAVGSLDGHLLLGVLQELVREIAQCVRIVPVHPVAEADRLLSLTCGLAQDAGLAFEHKRSEAIPFDVVLGLEPFLLLHLDLDPQPLAVEAVLIALLVTAHRPEALPQILIATSPPVVHAHRIVGRDGPVDKGPAGCPGA